MKKVLVVEDDQFLANAYRIKFEKANLDVKISMDGEEALEVIKTFKPDVILLDLVMPKMDGFAVLEKLKSDISTKDIKVVVASNLGQSEDVARAIKLGASGYVIKSDMSIADILKLVE
jgi:CheY-like chemotaxis protein